MSEWTTCLVDDIKATTKNALVTGPFGSAIGSRFFTDSGIPLIRGSNLSQDVGTRLIDDGFVFIDLDKSIEFSRSFARRGDLIFTCWGTIDQIGLIDSRSKFETYIVSNKQMKLTPDPDKVDSLFLYYLFSNPDARAAIVNRGIGSSVPGFNLGQLRSISLRLPLLAKQRAIAHILGTLDDKVELNRRMNETLEAMARAIFQSWFVDFDPVRAKASGESADSICQRLGLTPEILALFPDSFQDSELGEIPKGWKTQSFSEAIAINPTRTLKKGTVASYLDMANMPNASARARKIVEREFGSGMKFQNGDTLVARITPCLENGKTCFVDFLEDEQVGWGSTEYIVLRPNSPLPPEFGYFLARTEKFRDHAIANMTGTSGRQRVPASAFNGVRLVIPGTEVAKAFGAFAQATMESMRVRDSESQTLIATRDSLLPKLISGELSCTSSNSINEHA